MTQEASPRYLDGSPWTGRQTIAIFVAWLTGGILGALVSELLGFDPLDSAGGLAVIIACQSGAALLAVTLFSQSKGSGKLRTDVGLVVRPRDWFAILIGFAVQIAVAQVLALLIEMTDIGQETQAISDLADQTSGTNGRVLLFFSLVVAAPIVEEVLFRGVLLGWLVKRMGRVPAVVVSGAAFGIAHWEGPDVLLPVIGLFLIGLVLGAVATRYGNLSMVIFIHAGINLLGFLVLVFEDQILDTLDELESGISGLIRLLG